MPSLAIRWLSLHEFRHFTKNVISSHLFEAAGSFNEMLYPPRGPLVQIVLESPSAQILPFVPRNATSNRFTMKDRMDALAWDVAYAAPAGARLTIHARQRDDAPEVGDYIAIYRANDHWAVWGMAREGASITVWHGPTGTDLGSFTSMNDALAAVSASSIQPRAQRRKG